VKFLSLIKKVMAKKKIRVFKEFYEAHVYSVLNKIGPYRVIKAPNVNKFWAVELKNKQLLRE